MTEQETVQQSDSTQNTSRSGPFQSAVNLTVILAIAWALCFWPARMLNADTGVIWMSIAAICCLIPGWVVVFLTGLAIFPNDLSALLIQTMVRMSSVAGAAVIVRKLYPKVGIADFFGWLIGFYLLAMTVEVWMLRQLREESSGDSSHSPDSESKTA